MRTLDFGMLQPLRALTFLPVIVDPSQAMGEASLVPWACHAAIACGAHGLIIEVLDETTDRKSVLCDGAQGMRLSVLAEVTFAEATCRMHAQKLRSECAARRNGVSALFDARVPHDPSCVVQ